MNKLNRSLAKVNQLPSFLQSWARDWAIGRTVKFVGTAGVHFEKMTANEVVLSLANQTKVQNHIGQIHAAETATGMVVGMNIPDNKLPLMKNLSVKFIKRSQGQQRAVATLTNEQIATIQNNDKGDLVVPIRLTDETGEEVVIAEMTWAWVLKK
jgi:acyl-coenzyme A thioesterase PaaI-like protein